MSWLVRLKSPWVTGAGWVVSIVAAATLGYQTEEYLSRPKPGVLVSAVISSAEYNKFFTTSGEELVSIDEDLNERLDSSRWAPAILPPTQSVSTIADSLRKSAARIKKGIRDLQALSLDLDKFDEFLAVRSEESRTKLFQLRWKHNEIITAVSAGRYAQSVFELPEVKSNPLPGSVLSVTDKDGDFYLVSGQRIVPLIWSGAPFATRGFHREFFEWELSAWSSYDVGALKELVKQVRLEVEEVVRMNDLQESITEELGRLERWTVTTTLINEGGQPVSFSPYARLEVLSQGVHYKDDGRETPFAADRFVDLVSVDSSGTPQSTTVGPRSSVTQVFVATRIEDVYGNWREFKRVYQQGEARARLGLFVLSREVSDSDVTWSDLIPFSAFRYEEVFGER